MGSSNVTSTQIEEARRICDIVCVQNMYNVAHREDNSLIDELARDGLAYVPFFPLGGFTPLQLTGLTKVAKRLSATPMQVALAWLLQRAPNILLIPGTSSLDHLRENLAAASLELPGHMVSGWTRSDRTAPHWKRVPREAPPRPSPVAREDARADPASARLRIGLAGIALGAGVRVGRGERDGRGGRRPAGQGHGDK